jgi:hypothetical protein
MPFKLNSPSRDMTSHALSPCSVPKTERPRNLVTPNLKKTCLPVKSAMVWSKKVIQYALIAVRCLKKRKKKRHLLLQHAQVHLGLPSVVHQVQRKVALRVQRRAVVLPVRRKAAPPADPRRAVALPVPRRAAALPVAPRRAAALPVLRKVDLAVLLVPRRAAVLPVVRRKVDLAVLLVRRRAAVLPAVLRKADLAALQAVLRKADLAVLLVRRRAAALQAVQNADHQSDLLRCNNASA